MFRLSAALACVLVLGAFAVSEADERPDAPAQDGPERAACRVLEDQRPAPRAVRRDRTDAAVTIRVSVPRTTCNTR